jgi:2-(1,2-epoxy-1,2-dihydrophenyl)acetyl-CoA isomerase
MTQTSSPTLIVSRQNAVTTLTLNRPTRLNALTDELTIAFQQALREADADPAVRVVVIRGAGAAFMAGGDLGEFAMAPGRAEAMATRFQKAIEALTLLRKPTIASVHGAAAGGGLSLALACDLAIAADNARLIFAYTKLGVACDGGISYRLPRLVGMRKALEIALMDEPLGAADALRLGLVNRVVALEALEAETSRVANRLAGLDPLTAASIKSLFTDNWNKSFSDALDAEMIAFHDCTVRPEFIERVKGLLQRSKS